MCHVLFMDCVQSCVDFLIVLFMDCVQSWSLAPKLQEDWLGTKDEIGCSNVHLYNSNPHLDLVPQEIDPGHGTKIARGLVRYKG